MDRFVCLHGHFYQPPRENPWLEAIEVQDSAAPFHDWNERIQAECYAPNGASRIRRDFGGPVTRIVNNYRDISFNFGPTLLSWMERADPEAYEQILAGDRLSVEARGGHGNAIAQAYNHMIMPLASDRDRATQVSWGIADFRHRFAREPEGMWLPETAADLPTLRALARAGVAYTILSPYQARRVRPLRAQGRRGRAPVKGRRRSAASERRKKKSSAWKDVSGGHVDPTQAYWCDLGDGLGIALFFYDGPLASAVAFQGLLRDGREFGDRLLGAFGERSGPQLVNVATDGETYGHHHRHGDMALAAALQRVHAARDTELTNYGEFLARVPPAMEVEIHEPSSWSCAHGVGRWSRDCGCSAGTPGYHHEWRRPLREALDTLKDGLDELYEAEATRFLEDPWAARDAYVGVLLDGSEEFRREFLAEVGKGSLTAEDAVPVWQLLEMQRHGMLMFTSCGWFFDEISGIEGVQILRYAARALQLAERLGRDLSGPFLEQLEAAPSNVAHFTDGAEVMRRAVLPSVVDPDRILARHAIASCLDPPEEDHARVFSYEIHQQDYAREVSSHARVAVGRVRIVTTTTREEESAAFAVLHFGAHDFTCKVRRFETQGEYQAATDRVLAAFRDGSLREAVLALEEGFPGPAHDVRDLFLEERRRLMQRVLEGSLQRIESSYTRIFRENRRLMEFLAEIDIPVPEELAIAAGYVIRRDVEAAARELGSGAEDPERLTAVLDRLGDALAEGRALKLEVSTEVLEEALQGRLERELRSLSQEVDDAALEAALRLVELLRHYALDVELWRAENAVFRFLQGPYARLVEEVHFGDEDARQALSRARRLAERLGFHLEPLEVD